MVFFSEPPKDQYVYTSVYNWPFHTKPTTHFWNDIDWTKLTLYFMESLIAYDDVILAKNYFLLRKDTY